MNKHAIVILYVGKSPKKSTVQELAEVLVRDAITVPELLEIQHFDETSIAKAIVARAAQEEKTIDDAPFETESEPVEVIIRPGSNKVEVVKFIRNILGIDLKEAIEVVNNSHIKIPATVSKDLFVRGIVDAGGYIDFGSPKPFLAEQACYLLNSKYATKTNGNDQLKRDIIVAKYDDNSGIVSTYESALLGAVDIVKNNPELVRNSLNPTLFDVITGLNI